jgi:hypothetical protein
MIDQLINSIRAVGTDPVQARNLASWSIQIETLNPQEVDSLLAALVEITCGVTDHPLDRGLQPVIAALISRTKKKQEPLGSEWIERIRQLYENSPPTSPLRNYWLAWLATAGNTEAMQSWIGLLASSPPQHRAGIGLAFQPIMKRDFHPQPWLLDALLHEGVQHIQLAPAIYDLFNYYYRTKQVEDHPAASRLDELTLLLGQLVGQLGKIEEGSLAAHSDPQLIGQQVSDAVALIVALCDTLALNNHEEAIRKIHQALNLKHRRVQVEAAAALARLGDRLGREVFIKLAEEPVVRLRVLNYAEELDLTREISLEHRGEIAIAESQLAIWLAEPTQMGIAPSKIELVDNRELYWPSYEHPILCYVFRFEYGSGEHGYSNLAICGPMVHAFTADLKYLPIDDVYALFAGWQTVHDEIYQVSPERARQAFGKQWRHLSQLLEQSETGSKCEPLFLGSFFGKLAMVADCSSEESPGTVIVDSDSTTFVERGLPAAPITGELAYAIWRGRQLLSTFNPA